MHLRTLVLVSFQAPSSANCTRFQVRLIMIGSKDTHTAVERVRL